MPEGIYLGRSKNAVMSENTKDGIKYKKVDFYLPKKPEIVDTDTRQPPRFWLKRVDELRKNGKAIIATPEIPLVTPSAGAVSVYLDENGDFRYVSFSQKDRKSPRDPGFRVPRNGFPRSESDWFTNDHLYREAFEEGIFLTKDYPLPKLVITKNAKYNKIIGNVAKMLHDKAGLKTKGEKEVDITFRDGNDTLNVYSGKDKKLEDRGVISWTPETGFNFIKVMEVKYPIDELLLVDGETFPNGEPIGRDVCVINLHELSKGKKFGDIIIENVHVYDKNGGIGIIERASRFLTDKVPRSVLNQIYFGGEPVYPIDWMDESYDFISNRDILKFFEINNDPKKPFKWSTLEKNFKIHKRFVHD